MEQKKSLVVEIIGPAGAGKTTIRKALIEREARVRWYMHPLYRQRKDWGFFARNILALLPTLLRIALLKDGKKIKNYELAPMIILHGWAAELRKLASRQDGIILLDQGPVYMIGLLAFRGSPIFHQPVLESWWKTVYEKWSRTMDMIIFLDTNDEVLANRINTRGKWHQMVGQPMETAGDFLQRSRESLKDTVSILCSGNPEIRVLHFNTREKTVDQIIAEVTAVFDQHSASVQ